MNGDPDESPPVDEHAFEAFKPVFNMRKLDFNAFAPLSESTRQNVRDLILPHTNLVASIIGRLQIDPLKDLRESPAKHQQDWFKPWIADLNRVLQPLIDRGVFRNFERSMLPPNLQEVSGQIKPRQVHDFLETEGIALYLVPRGSVGVRLLQAPDHATRRKVLNDRFDTIVEDCRRVIEKATDPLVATEANFAGQAIATIADGHYASAQALCAVTLDTLIMRFYPDREIRTKITNRKVGTAKPDLIKDMGLREAYVWLPIWNSHAQFWKDKGDRVPSDFSRHATVHGVAKVQYNKRNCVQALMLVASLIGYADQIA